MCANEPSLWSDEERIAAEGGVLVRRASEQGGAHRPGTRAPHVGYRLEAHTECSLWGCRSGWWTHRGPLGPQEAVFGTEPRRPLARARACTAVPSRARVWACFHACH